MILTIEAVSITIECDSRQGVTSPLAFSPQICHCGHNTKNQMEILTPNSTATIGIHLPLLTRDVTIFWESCDEATYQVRRRDQVRLLAMRLLCPEELSYGRFANWAKYGATFA